VQRLSGARLRAVSTAASAALVWSIASAASAQAVPAADQAARIERLEAELKSVEAELASMKAAQASAPVTTQAPAGAPSSAAYAAADVTSPPNSARPADSGSPALQTVLPRSTGGDGSSASVAIGGGRPTIRSNDGNFVATLHGVMQFDAAAYDQDKSGPLTTDQRRDGPALGASATNVDAAHARNLKDGDLFRRARIGIDGTVYGDWDYRILFDFGGTGTENTGQVYETWVQYSGLKPFRFRIGAFPASTGLDDQGSTNGMPFLERAISSDIARGFAAGDTRTAAQIFGAGDHWFASAAVTGRTIGTLNTGTATAVAQTYGDQLGFVARLAASPLYGKDWMVHVGVHGSYIDRPADASGPGATGSTAISSKVIALSNTPELRVDGTKLINTGNIDARHADEEGLEFAAQKQNFFLQSEYENFDISRDDGFSSPSFHGYYVYGTWLITGEARKYNAQTAAFDAPPVNHPFNLKAGTWGAWELGVRYSDMDLNYHAGRAGTAQLGDSIRGGEEKTLTAGLNWYVNPVVRFMLDYSHVDIDRLSPATSASNASTVWLGAVGAQIGQTYDVVSLRSQVAF